MPRSNGAPDRRSLVKTEVSLPDTKGKSKASTEVRIYQIAEKIVKEGCARMDIIDYCQKEWGLSQTQAIRYWTSALAYLRPDNPEEYREALINRNFNVAEEILHRALEANNLKAASEALRILNSMLGVGSKAVEVRDKDGLGNDRVFTITFGE